MTVHARFGQGDLFAPRSAYVMSGPARWDWEHSVPPVERPRWSITLRTLA